MNESDRVFYNVKQKNAISLANAKKIGDFEGIDKILSKTSDDIIDIIKKSGLKGRGGAGFLTGLKWSFIAKKKSQSEGVPHYLVVNADESEPGTCKDREIIRYEPYKLIEGIIYACKAINASVCYIYIRGEYYEEAEILQNAINECEKDGLIGENALFNKAKFNNFRCKIHVHIGAGAYICGEETALLESLEGKTGKPRLKPPFPAQAGLYGSPTVVNNVETISVVPTILRRGADWFASLGAPNSAGVRLFSVCGNVNKPCIVEEEMGISIKDLIEKHAGGVIGGWKNLLAVIPGGSSTPLIPQQICETATMDFDKLAELKTAVGTGGLIVMNKQTNIVSAIARLALFYKEESCGQCSPCREGTGWIWRILNRMSQAEDITEESVKDDLMLLERLANQLDGNTICAFGSGAAWPIQGLIRHFNALLKLQTTNKRA